MLPYTGFGIPLVAFNSVTNLETSSVGTGAPVLAEGASTTSNKVFNSIKGDGTTTQVTLAPLLTGGDITVACTSNMLDKTTDQTIDSIKTFTKNPVVTNNAGDTGVIVNHIGTAGTGVGFAVAQDSASRIELGYNPTSTETYLWSKGAIDLKIATNNTERLRIKGTGLAVDNAGTPLAVSSTTLCLRNNLVDTSSTQTITGKTMAYGSNTFTGFPTAVNSGYAAYYISGPVSIGNVSDTTIPFDTAIATDSGISNSSGVFTISTAGIYTIVATVGFFLSAAGFRRVYVMLNSGGLQYGQNRQSGSGTADTIMITSFTGKLNVGDTIQIKALQSSGGSLNLIGYSSFAGTSTTLVQISRVS